MPKIKQGQPPAASIETATVAQTSPTQPRRSKENGYKRTTSGSGTADGTPSHGLGDAWSPPRATAESSYTAEAPADTEIRGLVRAQGYRDCLRKINNAHQSGTIPPIPAGLKDPIMTMVNDCFHASEQRMALTEAQQWHDKAVQDIAEQLESLPDSDVDTKAALVWMSRFLDVFWQERINSLKDETQQPTEHAQRLLSDIATAAQLASRKRTVSPEHVVSAGNTILPTVFHTGDEIWPAAGALIERARDKIQIEVFLFFKTSESAKHIMGAVANLQKELATLRCEGKLQKPVELEILVDDYRHRLGATTASGGDTNPDADKVRTESPTFYYKLFPFQIDPTLIQVKVLGYQHRKRGAIHAKTLTVDGRWGLVSTANIKGNHHRISMGGVPMHDAAVVVSGPMVQAIEDDFRSNSGKKQTRLVASNRRETWRYGEKRFSEQLQNVQHWIKPHALEDDIAAATVRAKRETLIRHLDGVNEQLQGNAHVVVLAKAPDNSYYSGNKNSPLRAGILAALRGAQHSIEINNVNLNVDEVIAELTAALERGVHVKILMPDGANNRVYRRGNKSNGDAVTRLLRYLYKNSPKGLLEVRWHTDLEGYKTAGANHSKAMFIDEEVATLGSANLDNQSMKYSGELVFATHHVATVKRLREALFLPFWGEGAKAFELGPRAKEG